VSHQAIAVTVRETPSCPRLVVRQMDHLFHAEYGQDYTTGPAATQGSWDREARDSGDGGGSSIE